jgi:hypothetical protein
MSSPFVEAHQFKGVSPDPAKAEMANRELAKPRERRDPPFNTLEGEDMLRKMLQPPPYDGNQSVYFKDGTSFDIQEKQGRQYLVLPRENKQVVHQHVNVGEWVCQLPSGKFIKLSDQDYRAMVGGPTSSGV